jgi:hypothetical protein
MPVWSCGPACANRVCAPVRPQDGRCDIVPGQAMRTGPVCGQAGRPAPRHSGHSPPAGCLAWSPRSPGLDQAHATHSDNTPMGAWSLTVSAHRQACPCACLATVRPTVRPGWPVRARLPRAMRVPAARPGRGTGDRTARRACPGGQACPCGACPCAHGPGHTSLCHRAARLRMAMRTTAARQARGHALAGQATRCARRVRTRARPRGPLEHAGEPGRGGGPSPGSHRRTSEAQLRACLVV